MLKRLFSAIGKRFFPVMYARHIGVNVGDDCRLIQCEFSSEPYLISIGNHVSATSVRFETHDGGVWCIRNKYPELDIVKPILIGDNVYIGYGAIILPGVNVGSNSIIGAYSVVSRDVPPGSVFAGVPARFIRTLDEYSVKSLKSGEMTKKMSAAEKRKFYVEKFKKN